METGQHLTKSQQPTTTTTTSETWTKSYPGREGTTCTSDGRYRIVKDIVGAWIIIDNETREKVGHFETLRAAKEWSR